MPAFIKVNGSTPRLECDLKLLDSSDWKFTRNHYGMELMGGTIVYLSGKNEGEVCFDGKIAANQNVEIRLGTIRPVKREVLLTFNPELLKTCQVSAVPMFAPGEEQYVTLTLSCFKATDISELGWIVRLYTFE
jgi:hypothetical protein